MTAAEIEALADRIAADIVKRLSPAGGVAWVLLIAEPGHEGALRSNYTEREAVATSLRETLRLVYGEDYSDRPKR